MSASGVLVELALSAMKRHSHAPLLGSSDVGSTPESGHSIRDDERCFIGLCRYLGIGVGEATTGRFPDIRTPAFATHLKVIDAPPNRTPSRSMSSIPLQAQAVHPSKRRIDFHRPSHVPTRGNVAKETNQRLSSPGALSMGAQRPPPFNSQSETAETEWRPLIAGS
jgi:hypothetical protein